MNEGADRIPAVAVIIAVAREAAIPMRMLAVLACVADMPGASVKHVAQRLDCAKSSVSQAVDLLVLAGLAERDEDPADRRRVRLHPRSGGLDLLRRIQAASV
jgi:DNA-binding MarR family transcriptional regulator